MNDERCRALAREALLRTLEPAERRELDELLAASPECRAFARSLEGAHVALEEWGATEPDAIVPLRLPAAEVGASRAASGPTPRDGVAPGRRARSGGRGVPTRWAAAAVVALLSFVGGVGVGATAFGPPAGSGASAEPGTYALFFEEPEESWPRATDPAGFAAWADRLSEADAFEGGLRLTEEEGLWVPRAGPAVATGEVPPRRMNLSGAFFVRAPDYEAAVAIAREGAHLVEGGVLVRRVAFRAGPGPDWREVR